MTGDHEPTQTGAALSMGFFELAKLYMQQFGLLTFGTVTVILMQYAIFTPQLSRNQEVAQQQTKLTGELMDTVSKLKEEVQNLKEEVAHARQTAELTDRALLRLEKP